MEVDHLTTIVLNSIGNYDGTNVGKVLADARNVHDLQNWTLDVSSEMTIDDYLYRLKVARVSLSRSVEETMLAVVGNTPLEAGQASPVMMSSVLLDSEHHLMQHLDMNGENSSECSKLCQAGNEPTKISDCISYCQKLLINAVELRKNPHRRPYVPSYNVLLFEGTQDVDATTTVPEATTAAVEDNFAAMELSVSEGRNKLLTKDSVHLLMLISLGVGILLVFLNYILEKSGKNTGGGHTFLSRPVHSPQPIAPTESRLNQGYIPISEEESKSACENHHLSSHHSAASSLSIKID